MAVRPGRAAGLWLVEFEQGGVRIHKRLPPGTSKAQAEAWERQRRRELFDRELGKFPEVTLKDAIDTWLRENRRKNQKQALSEAKQWERYVEGRRLRDAPQVAQEALARWTSEPCAERLRTPRTNGQINAKTPSSLARASTINRRLALLKAVCRHSYKRGLIAENLSGRITLLREDNRKEVYLTSAQVSSLARSAPPQTQAAIMLLAYSGLRASELLSLGPTTMRAATLAVAESKTGKPRYVPIAQPARSYLSALPLQLSYWQLRKEFIAARKKAKLPPTVTLHTLRHSFASWLINAGVDLYTVGKILGHSSPQTTQRYAHLHIATLKSAVDKLK